MNTCSLCHMLCELKIFLGGNRVLLLVALVSDNQSRIEICQDIKVEIIKNEFENKIGFVHLQTTQIDYTTH